MDQTSYQSDDFRSEEDRRDHTVSYKCPNCDAGLLFSAEKQKFVCEFCLSHTYIYTV